MSSSGSNFRNPHKSRLGARVYIPAKGAVLAVIFAACMAVAGWTGYLAYGPAMGFAAGAAILAADVAVLAWAMSLIRQHQASAFKLTILSSLVVLIILTLTAYSGIEPFSGAKDWIASGLS